MPAIPSAFPRQRSTKVPCIRHQTIKETPNRKLGWKYVRCGSTASFMLYSLIQKAREAMQSAKVSSKLASLLNRIADYPNIPRKKKKFEVEYSNGGGMGGTQMLVKGHQ